ncbi:MAG: choice-of-anchor B family protein [Lewinellaceae bacterium]|nr:choice-of-anchor B family protein [Saprospiraceae bacterium]MCB9330792.1 choice-of-anchor B family protein [Lewinellaceae bacterium]
MRIFLAIFLNSICLFNLQAQDSLNMTLLARWDDDSLPIASPNNLRVQYSGCWGLAVNEHEFAILGGARDILVFDITLPTKPELVAKFEGQTNTVWREFKSYKNRVYGVSDATTEGLMIFDFNNAPDTIIRTYYSNTLFNSAHTITLDTSSGRIYLNGSDAANNGLLVLDISQDPDKPKLLASYGLPGGYIHDSYVRNDTVYASSGYTGFYVYDYTDPGNPKTLASLPATGGYHHNNWLSQDGHYAFATEEIPSGRPILVIDLQDIENANLEVAASFIDPLMTAGQYNAIPHNVYVKDNLLFDSQYEDGLLIYDISNPLSPNLIGYYDTHPQNTQYNTYRGCWGNYPWLPSGTIIAGDMQNGLQLLKFTGSTNAASASTNHDVHIYPNPVDDLLTISLPKTNQGRYIRLLNLSGHILSEYTWSTTDETYKVRLHDLPASIYFIEIRFASGDMAIKKVLKK